MREKIGDLAFHAVLAVAFFAFILIAWGVLFVFAMIYELLAEKMGYVLAGVAMIAIISFAIFLFLWFKENFL